jgi:hypothetical protein
MFKKQMGVDAKQRPTLGKREEASKKGGDAVISIPTPNPSST